MTTNYNRWATVVSLAEALRYAGEEVGYFTDIGSYPLASLERLIRALMKDSPSALCTWESSLTSAKPAFGATAEHAADTIANYNRRRDALVAFLKSE